MNSEHLQISLPKFPIHLIHVVAFKPQIIQAINQLVVLGNLTESNREQGYTLLFAKWVSATAFAAKLFLSSNKQSIYFPDARIGKLDDCFPAFWLKAGFFGGSRSKGKNFLKFMKD